MEEYDVESILDMYEDDYVPEPRPMMAGGGQLVQPNADGSRPGYGGKVESTKHLGTADKKYSGVYEETYKGGTKSYYGKYIRDGKSFKKNFKDKDDALKFVTEGRKTPPAKNVIDIQSESGTLLEQPKYKTNLTKALNEVTALQEKGYGNIDEIVKKYQKIFTQKIGSKTKTGKTVKTGVGSTEYKAITFAIREYAKKLGIQSINNSNVIKALDAYSKIKNPKRGDIPKILKRYNAPAGTFNKYLQEDKLNLRKKIPLQFGSEAEKKKYYYRLRRDAINEFSSKKFERFFSAPETSLVQKSHLGDLYNQYVRTGNLGYAPNLINQETLKDVDAILKEYNEQINDLFKNKPKGYRNKIDLLNQKGTDLAAATQGYKKFTGRDPFTGKEFTINFSKPSQELDPGDLFKNKKLSDLTTADKPTLEMLKEMAMKNAKLSKTKTNKMNKLISTEVNNLLLDLAGKVTDKCNIGNAEGGRIGFQSGRNYCLNVGRQALEKGLKTGFPKNQQVLAEGILKAGRSLKDIASLRGLLGPAALAFTAAAEAGLVGYDMLSSGKSFKEAVGGSLFNYMLGDKTKIDLDEEIIKRLRSIPGAPSQGFREFTEEDIGKMQAFKSGLMEISDLNEQFGKLDTIQKNREALEMSPEDSAFNKGAFQLDKEEDLVRQNIQDFYRSGGQQRLENVDYGEGAKQLLRGNLLAEQDQLFDAGIGKFYQSPKGDEKRISRLNDIRYQLDKLQNPTQYDEFGEYFMSRPQSEQSYLMGLGYSGGGIATLQNKKKTNTQKLASVYKNPGFKYWAVPPKKGPASKGLKVPPKQVKKV